MNTVGGLTGTMSVILLIYCCDTSTGQNPHWRDLCSTQFHIYTIMVEKIWWMYCAVWSLQGGLLISVGSEESGSINRLIHNP